MSTRFLSLLFAAIGICGLVVATQTQGQDLLTAILYVLGVLLIFLSAFRFFLIQEIRSYAHPD